jgi:phage-related protein
MIIFDNMRRNIRFYRTIVKKCPVQEFLDSLSGKIAQKITWVLKIIEDLDIVPEKYFKKLDSTDIWECRIDFSGNTYRILGFIHNRSNVILTNGFMKKTRKIPKQKIELALKYKHDYLNNGGDKR